MWEKVLFAGVRKIIKRGTILTRHRTGRPRKTTSREDRRLARAALTVRRDTKSAILRKSGSFWGCIRLGVCVSRRTVSRRLKEVGIRSRRALMKPRLSDLQKRNRLYWARQHEKWTLEQWKRVLWTDESYFRCMVRGFVFRLKSSGRSLVWRRVGSDILEECVTGTVRWGNGGLMVWGLISGIGIRHLIRLPEETVDAKSYQETIAPVLASLPSIRSTVGKSLVWMQDGAPAHSAKSTKAMLERSGICKWVSFI